MCVGALLNEVYMKLKNPFSHLTKFELILWLVSLTVVAASFIFSSDKDYLTLAASLVGVTALIFIAKGLVFGQVMCVIFAVLYGIVSWNARYYGEMITYIGMSAPAAIASIISWLKNPYGKNDEVKVNRLSSKTVILVCAATAAVTVAFYFILGALGTASLWVSTLSVATSFMASALTFLRSPYYAIGYAANDVVLIVLWIISASQNISDLPMIFCFVMFLLNDLYGFISWRRMEKRQKREKALEMQN